MRTMKMNHGILTRSILPAIAAAVVMLVVLTGCKKHAEGDGHDHGSKAPAKADEHAGHDHGAESGGKEEHTDEVKLTAEAVERYGVKVQAAQLWVLKPTSGAPARVGVQHRGDGARRLAAARARGRGQGALGRHVKAGQELVVIESPELGEAQADYLQKKTPCRPPGRPSISPRSRGSGPRVCTSSRRASRSPRCSGARPSTRPRSRRQGRRGRRDGRREPPAPARDEPGRGRSLASDGRDRAAYAIKAAIDGQVVQREVTLGELVGPDREASWSSRTRALSGCSPTCPRPSSRASPWEPRRGSRRLGDGQRR
jgi:hypothetical protein